MSFRDLETSYSSPRSQIFLSKDIPYRVKCNFSQNINTLNLLISNRVSREFTPGDANPFDTKKIFRKYYGKKISKSVCLDQDFPKSLALACKRVKKLRLQNSFNVKAHFPALRDLNLFYESSFSTFRKPTNISRLFIQSKQIESFTANYLLKHLSFKHLRILNKLQALTLTLFPLNFIPFYESIKRTRTIQKLNLKIKSSHKITYHKNNFIKLMDHLLSHNKIHTLKLSFPDGWLECDFLETLFSVINMHQVSSWYIQANTFRINLFESKNLEVKKFLSSVDFLWLGSNQLVSEGSNPMFLNLDFKRPPDIGTIIGNKRKYLI